MFNWFKNVFRSKPDASKNGNAVAHENLNRLRRDELSAGAYMRRGEPVTTFPGLTSGSMIKPKALASRAIPSKALADTATKSNDGDFGTSMLVSAGTGSTMLGYSVGGSLTGALIGSSMHQDAPSQSYHHSSHAPSNCYVSSSLETDSGSCDFE
ncbi:MAG: hypothetical protein V4713_03655 [Pseudomonadota bacterium]